MERLSSAVWFAGTMGLLEDAIREHLELKRLRGADPAEVAREQREALDRPPGMETVGATEGQPAVAEAVAEPVEAPSRGEPAAGSGSSADPGGFSSVGQETAELDMEAVLNGEDRTPAEQDVAEGSKAAGHERSAASGDEDSLEWEVPAASSRDPASDPGSDSADEPPEDEHDSAPGASEHEPSTEELRRGRTDDQQQAPGQGRLSL